jgi:putative acetyltransferase
VDKHADYTLELSTDDSKYGGQDLVSRDVTYFTKEFDGRKFVELYLPARTAIVLKETGRVIGSIGLHNDDRRTAPHVRMIGYALSESHWNQGLMSEATAAVLGHAFGHLHLDLVSAYCHRDNVASTRVLEKCGFTKEGTLRWADRMPQGKTVDLLCYSILKEEYNRYRKEADG